MNIGIFMDAIYASEPRQFGEMTNEELQERVVEISEENGVDLVVELVDEEIRIYNIDRQPTSKKGSGAAAIDELKNIALVNDLSLGLAAENGNFGLIKYYASLGFVSNQYSDMTKWLEAKRIAWEQHLSDPTEELDHENMVWRP